MTREQVLKKIMEVLSSLDPEVTAEDVAESVVVALEEINAVYFYED